MAGAVLAVALVTVGAKLLTKSTTTMKSFAIFWENQACISLGKRSVASGQISKRT